MNRKEPINRRKIIETGVLFSLLALLAGMYLNNRIFFIAASVLLVIMLIFPVVLKPLAIVWFGLSIRLGWVMSRFLLIIIFYLIVLPVGLSRKAFGVNALKSKAFNNQNQTFWVNRDHLYKSEDLTRPF